MIHPQFVSAAIADHHIPDLEWPPWMRTVKRMVAHFVPGYTEAEQPDPILIWLDKHSILHVQSEHISDVHTLGLLMNMLASTKQAVGVGYILFADAMINNNSQDKDIRPYAVVYMDTKDTEYSAWAPVPAEHPWPERAWAMYSTTKDSRYDSFAGKRGLHHDVFWRTQRVH